VEESLKKGTINGSEKQKASKEAKMYYFLLMYEKREKLNFMNF